MKHKSDKNGIVYSTNPDYAFDYGEEETITLEPAKQNLRVMLDKKQRAGKKVTLIDSIDEHRVRVFELNVTSINDKKMHANWKIIRYIDGKEDASGVGTISFTKVTRDYSEAILGTWENHEVRLEYKADGTFDYYSQNDAGEWVPSEDDFAEYFVDGNLLCTRWKNSGEGQLENREWWEIKSIENGVMTWTALRLKGDGSTYIVTFELSKVED